MAHAEATAHLQTASGQFGLLDPAGYRTICITENSQPVHENRFLTTGLSCRCAILRHSSAVPQCSRTPYLPRVSLYTAGYTALCPAMSEDALAMVALLTVKDLQVEFHTRDGVVKAVNGVTFSLERGK